MLTETELLTALLLVTVMVPAPTGVLLGRTASIWLGER